MSTPVLLVTGGARGIGAAICRQAVAAGYLVGINYAQDAAAAEALASSLPTGRAVPLQADIADAEAVAHLFEQLEQRLGSITALVNNADITGGLATFNQTSHATMRRVLDVNVLGTLYCAQAATTRWQQRGTAGAMVNLSSIAATLGAPHEYVHYAASKGAIDSFTIGLAKELASTGIRINAVSPGIVDTDIHARGGDPGRPARIAHQVPLGRVAQPAEVAEAVMWLLSDKASYITGSILRVGGGR